MLLFTNSRLFVSAAAAVMLIGGHAQVNKVAEFHLGDVGGATRALVEAREGCDAAAHAFASSLLRLRMEALPRPAASAFRDFERRLLQRATASHPRPAAGGGGTSGGALTGPLVSAGGGASTAGLIGGAGGRKKKGKAVPGRAGATDDDGRGLGGKAGRFQAVGAVAFDGREA